MRKIYRLAGCGLLGLGLLGLSLTVGCGGPDPAKNPNFNPQTLDNPTAVKRPEIPGGPGGGPGGPGRPGGPGGIPGGAPGGLPVSPPR